MSKQTMRLWIHHDQIVRQRIQTVVQAFLAAIKKLLRGERHENGRAAGGQAALDLDLAVGQRQAGHKALFLLEVKAAQLTVMLLGDTDRLKHIVFQLLLGAPSVQHEECHQKHSLILALQLFQ